jgi:hypothetical protein
MRNESRFQFLRSLLEGSSVVKRRIFVSYHHHQDQWYYDEFVHLLANSYEVFSDMSLQREIDSVDDDYVRFQIRDKNIRGSSCTVVLCGAETYERKYVDWEIKATLDKLHALVGVWLPTLRLIDNGAKKPERLQDNVDSGYAKWIKWRDLTSNVLTTTIESAIASERSQIVNHREIRKRNG